MSQRTAMPGREVAPLLEVRSLGLSVDGRSLFEGLSFGLGAGDRLALQGPSGSGKTSALRAIAGLIDATSGTVLLEGVRPADIGWPRFRRRVLYVGQQPALHDATVESNLARPFAYASSGRAFDRERATVFLRRLGLDDQVLSKNARALSVGEQQRVCLARALLLEPQVLLLDEPTSALDAGASDAAENVITETASTLGTAVVFVTHNTAQAERVCSRTVEMPKPAGAR